MHGKWKEAGERGGSEKVFEFSELLVSAFCLRLWCVIRCGGRRYAPMGVAVLTGLTIHVSMVEKSFIAQWGSFRPPKPAAPAPTENRQRALAACRKDGRLGERECPTPDTPHGGTGRPP